MAKRRSPVFLFFLFVLLAALAGGAYFLFKDLHAPTITMPMDSQGRISPTKPITISTTDPSGIRAIEVTIRRSGQSMVIYQEKFPTLFKSQNVSFSLKDAKLPDGTFDLEVKAWDGSFAGLGRGNVATATFTMQMDTQAPRIAVKTLAPAIKRGGSGLITYAISEDVAKTGVQVKDMFFEAYKQPSGLYVCLFPFPYNMTTADYSPEIMAEDYAGNSTSSRLLINAQARTFTTDTLNIGDSFLNAKAEELAKLCPEETIPLAQYICVNSKARIENDTFLLSLGQNSAPTFLASGPFVRLPKAAQKAGFGDFRTYMSGGEKIDEQHHTGVDLASTAKADVPAANSGVVVFTGYLGIYGNLVVVDHGLGLMSLYAHLTRTDVKEGDVVKTGQVVGSTGTTGLAVGDHVHFGFLVHGIPVHVGEWLDANWVKNNITSRMK